LKRSSVCKIECFDRLEFSSGAQTIQQSNRRPDFSKIHNSQIVHRKLLSRLHVQIQGLVQGVGFRPFVYRLATKLQLVGWVNNTAEGVFIEVEGDRNQLLEFQDRLDRDKPPHAQIDRLETQWLESVGYTQFEIRTSERNPHHKTALVLPDLATCPDCLQDLFDRSNPRYRYPFTNCTNCGPRYSIIETLPYDRSLTTMRDFPMCSPCQQEYDNPLDRRFHAQPNACPRCGPHLELWNPRGDVLATHDDALKQAETAIRQGQIVALKGLGGFQLLVDARNDAAVKRLRDRKHRPDKPFAVMYPNLEAVTLDCKVRELEAQILQSPPSPIVILSRVSANPKSLGRSVAPDNPNLGVMLPYTPLHHLLLADLGFPLVATSGNVSDEPICIDNLEALERLGQIADVLLVHNRPIARPVDDSIVRVMAQTPVILRRARGYAPLPISSPHYLPTASSPHRSILAVGGHLKNTIAIAFDDKIFPSQHVGDLNAPQTRHAFEYTIDRLCSIYDFKPQIVACDLHPDYASTQFAQAQNLPLVRVQHHYAHVLSCMAEHQLKPPVLGVAWDGTGYGLDGTIWGGEFLVVTETGFERVAHFRSFPLPGGDRAVKEPRRAALGLLYELFGEGAFSLTELPTLQAFSKPELQLLASMLRRGVNAPQTSSVGRLFDGIASLLGIRQTLSFEGQGAMALEFAASCADTTATYPFSIEPSISTQSGCSIVDWEPLLLALANDWRNKRPISEISAKFHHTLVEIVLAIANSFSNMPVVLTGGCFQNCLLLEQSIERLQPSKFQSVWPQKIPPNDGGIAIGQVMAALLKKSLN